jgi:hypothetical protein
MTYLQRHWIRFVALKFYSKKMFSDFDKWWCTRKARKRAVKPTPKLFQPTILAQRRVASLHGCPFLRASALPFVPDLILDKTLTCQIIHTTFIQSQQLCRGAFLRQLPSLF